MRLTIPVTRHVLSRTPSVHRRSCMASSSSQPGAAHRQEHARVFSVDSAVRRAVWRRAPALTTLPTTPQLAPLRCTEGGCTAHLQVRATLLQQGASGPAGSVTLSIPHYDGRPSRHDILVSANSTECLETCLSDLRARFAAEIASRRSVLTLSGGRTATRKCGCARLGARAPLSGVNSSHSMRW